MYRFIQAQSQNYPVQVLCQTLHVSRSGYYEWLKPTPAPVATDINTPPNEVDKPDNTQQIKDLFGVHRRRYGTRRLVDAMNDRGVKVSRDFVRKVLVKTGLKPIQPQRRTAPKLRTPHDRQPPYVGLLTQPVTGSPPAHWSQSGMGIRHYLYPLIEW